MSRPVIEMLFDFASPWSYLADARLERELDQLPVRIVRVPVYMRGLAMFRKELPHSTAKLAYLQRDLARCARYHGVPLGEARYPINGSYMLRGYLCLDGMPEQEPFRREAFRATWVDGANTSDPEVVVDLGASLGLERTPFATSIAQVAVQHRLLANTERAASRQVFGVPTFFVGAEMFWGQDRLDYLRRHVERVLCRLGPISDSPEA